MNDEVAQRRMRRWLESAKADHGEASTKLHALISRFALPDEECRALWEHVANTACYINNALQCVPEIPKKEEELPPMNPRRTWDAWINAKIEECEERGG